MATIDLPATPSRSALPIAPGATPPVAPRPAMRPAAPAAEPDGKALEQLLAGGVKLMTDILATARPEVFQKAAKVQRWARRLAKHMRVEKTWELDLAALLYPMGLISLPDALADRYAADMPLQPEEAARIEASALVASRLIANIPRMEGVARTVFYAHKGFDGSGWPKDGPAGEDLPQAARILKVLIDLADLATGSSRTREAALARMAEHAERYDPKVLAVATRVLRVPETQPSEINIEIPPQLAHTGDVLVHDLIDEGGRLLLSAGVELTELSAQRLVSLAQSRQLPATIMVTRLGPARPQPSGPLPDTELF